MSLVNPAPCNTSQLFILLDSASSWAPQVLIVLGTVFVLLRTRLLASYHVMPLNKLLLVWSQLSKPLHMATASAECLAESASAGANCCHHSQ